jgi:CHASE2 domain-containing sensor protein
LVDYGALDSVEVIRATNGAPLRDESQRDGIFGKLVLVGDATLGKATDTFQVPGQQQPYPGVFLHACAAQTLIDASLYELTRTGRLVLDVLLSAVILAALVLIGLFYRDRKSRAQATSRLRGTLTWLTLGAAIVIGVIFVRITRVMWDDFFLALLLLMFHPAIEERAESLWEKLKRALSRSRHLAGEETS